MSDPSFTLREISAVVFVNPSAAGGRAEARVRGVRRALGAEGLRAQFWVTEDAIDLEIRVGEAIDDGRRLLLAMGGDGTFQGLVNGAFGADVVLGVLPCGGGNDFAAALGLPKDAVAAARALSRCAPRAVDLLRARTADGRTRLYAGGGGMGLDVEASRYARERYRRLPGRLRYVAGALRAFGGLEPLRVRVEFPGEEQSVIEKQVLLAGVLNTPTYGAGLRLAPAAQIDDGMLDIALLQDLSWRQVMKLLPRLLHRGEVPERYVKRVRGRKVRLSAERPCFFHGDGEILGPAPVEIEIVPSAVRVLAPTVS